MTYVLPSLFGGPVGGPYAERHANHRTQFLVVTLLGASVLTLLPFVGLAGAIAVGVVFSFSYGVIYAVMYVLPHFWSDVPPAEIPLAIGLFNSIQLAGGAGVSFLFGWIVSVRSYAFAWEVLAGVVALTLLALVALPATRPRAAGPPDAADPSRRGAPAR
jgi:predicted MFS family arabinose efflux permease